MENITGLRIKKYRNELSLTQTQLGDIVHVTKQSVSKWEKGTNIPEPPILKQLASLFNCSVDYLLGRSELKTSDNQVPKSSNAEDEFDEEIKAIARNMKTLSTEKRKLLNDLVKTMSETADEELKK